ncbi:hypothetical protein [Jatrophihabitans lederbergiae]|uniref:Secreted protein n=1 Tax=Jatrophihabitans lederbergiae TaxID=3075547 RepID=A0ABU2JHT4_9ACTN|nr:hypothetical protein [Jatrophihabitans sp. DSM 44399]MDT0264540.1 hypothetical protein [Jatrophihabitans sp. DSM 44399]
MKRNKRLFAVCMSAAALVVAIVPTSAGATRARVVPRNPASELRARNQCSTPTTARSGGWVCVTSSTRKQVTPSVAQSGYCGVGVGCWTVYDDFRAGYYATNIEFGYNGRHLGETHIDYTWQLTGAQTQANPIRVRVNTNVSAIIFSGDLANGGVGRPTDGGSVISQCAPVVGHPQLANTLISWTPNGCRLYDNNNADHNMAIETGWELPGYSGYWYVYARSPVAHGPYTYRFPLQVLYPVQLPSRVTPHEW